MKKAKIIKDFQDVIEEYKQNPNLKNYSYHDGICTIFLNLSNEDIYQKYSNESLLNPEIYDFIENTYSYINKKDKLVISISFKNDITDEEKKKILLLLKSRYAIKIVESSKEIKRNNILTFLFLLVGSIFFIVYELINWKDSNFLFSSIFEIFSWVFIWEACYLFFFTNSSERINRFKYMKIFNSIDKI